MGKATKGHQGTAIPQCWMSPTSRAARDRHHGLPPDIGTCPSHGKLMVLLPGWGWPRQLWGGHRSILLALGSCQSPQGTEHPEGAKLEPPIQVEHPQVHPCRAWCHFRGLGAGGTCFALQELCSANCSN